MANSEIKKIGVMASGGDAPGMNACIRAVVRTAIWRGCAAAGIRRGYAGMVEGEIQDMDAQSVSNIIQRGGAILQSARSAAFMTREGRDAAFANLRANGIDALVVIGGDGTYTGARVFMEEHPGFPVVGCPGTIDNDLSGTDATIGFDTAVNTAVQAIDKLRDTADAHGRLFFVEVMGRDAGFIALHAGVSCGAEAVLLPETITDLDELIGQLERDWARKKRSSIIVVSEGDDAGNADEIARRVAARFDKYDARVARLGHVQRGGSPTAADRLLGSKLGAAAVDALLSGGTGIALGAAGTEVVKTPLAEAVRKTRAPNPLLLQLAESLVG